MASQGSFLICRIGRDRIAIDSGRVREILPLLPLWRPPGLPRPLAGFVRVRGEVVPVLAPRLLFDAAAELGPIDAFAHIVRPHGPIERFPCLLVDRAEDMVRPGPDGIREIGAEASQNGAFAAEIALEDGLAHLLSLDRLLTEAEQVRLATLAEQAERRATEWGVEERA